MYDLYFSLIQSHVLFTKIFAILLFIFTFIIDWELIFTCCGIWAQNLFLEMSTNFFKQINHRDWGEISVCVNLCTCTWDPLAECTNSGIPESQGMLIFSLSVDKVKEHFKVAVTVYISHAHKQNARTLDDKNNSFRTHTRTNTPLWGTVPSVGNVAQPPLGKASGERGWRAGPTSMDTFSSGKSGLHCT